MTKSAQIAAHKDAPDFACSKVGVSGQQLDAGLLNRR